MSDARHSLSAHAVQWLRLSAIAASTKKGLFPNEKIEGLDWLIVLELCANQRAGRFTVVKGLIEATGRSNGTIRSSLNKFLRLGYATVAQTVGRSVLYQPTPQLIDAVNNWASDMTEALQRSTDLIASDI